MRAGALAACLILAGCQLPEPVRTASGQPEIQLTGVDYSCVRNAMLEVFANGKWQIKSATDFQIIAGKERRDDIGFLYSTRAYGFPEDRVTALMIQQPDRGMRIVISESIVSNPGTGFERANPINQDNSVQTGLAAVSSGLSERCAAH